MIIPHEQLSDSALRGLMEEFITREGTDYGWVETSLERMVEQVRGQIERGDVVIVFDPATESVSLLTKREARELGND
nr:YheU family protein [Marinimicrobium agarilyticum]